MADLATILGWQARTRVIRSFNFEQFMLSNLFAGQALQTPVEGKIATWDVRVPVRKGEVYNAHGAKAQIRNLESVRSDKATMLRKYDRRDLDGDTLNQIRNEGDITKQNRGRSKIVGEQQEMAEEINRAMELSISRMLTPGSSNFIIQEGNSAKLQGIDPSIPASNHDLSGGSLTIASWGTASTDILGEIETMKNALTDASGFVPEQVIARSSIRGFLMKNTTVTNWFGGSEAAARIISSGDIIRFMGMDWHFYDGSYVDESGSTQKFLATDTLIMSPKPSKRWWELQVGSELIANADLSDLIESSGLNSWSRVRDDPAGLSLFALHNWFPCLLVPGAVVHVVVT